MVRAGLDDEALSGADLFGTFVEIEAQQPLEDVAGVAAGTPVRIGEPGLEAQQRGPTERALFLLLQRMRALLPRHRCVADSLARHGVHWA